MPFTATSLDNPHDCLHRDDRETVQHLYSPHTLVYDVNNDTQASMDRRKVIISEDLITAVQKVWRRDYDEALTREEARRKASIIMRAIQAQERRR